jgi:hypothetical protein
VSGNTLAASQVGPNALAPGSAGSSGTLIGRALPVATYVFAILLVLGDYSRSAAGPNPENQPVQTIENLVETTFRSEISPLELRLETPVRVRAGDLVPLRLVLANPTDEAVRIDLGGDPTAFDFIISTIDGVEIWRRLEGFAVGETLVPWTLEPGSSIRFTATWSQRDNDDRPVGSGRYRIAGTVSVPGTPDGWVTESRAFTIVPPSPAATMATTR